MKITITDLSEKLRAEIYIASGLATIINALADNPHKHLPGFMLAKAIADREMADHSSVRSVAVYKEIARHGHDISKVKEVLTTMVKGRIVLEVTFFDLADEGE